MQKVGLFFHPDCDLHDHPGHPESARRAQAILSYIESGGLADKLTFLAAEPCTREQLLLNHTAAYIERVEQACRHGETQLDPDTYINPASFEAARLSYGGALLAVDKVMSGELQRAFCLLRPPGHHAYRDRSMGFCLFNNIAGAAFWALQEHGLERVAIVDFDGHHGNGTQDSFYDDPRVYFTSSHAFPFYPGTGAASERGRGAGDSCTLNLPLPYATTGLEALALYEKHWLPAMAEFRPQLILISAGFDAHRLDPLVNLAFEDEDFLELTRLVCRVAERFCNGRVVSSLEGGYHLEMLARCAGLHLKGLLDE